VVQNGWRRGLTSAYLDTLPNLIKEGGANGLGTLRFISPETLWSSKRNGMGAWNDMSVGSIPVLRDIEDVDSVYRLICDQRDHLHTAKSDH